MNESAILQIILNEVNQLAKSERQFWMDKEKNCCKLFSEFVRTPAYWCMGGWRKERHRFAPFRFVQWNVVNFWFTPRVLPTVSFYRRKSRTSLWEGWLWTSFQAFIRWLLDYEDRQYFIDIKEGEKNATINQNGKRFIIASMLMQEKWNVSSFPSSIFIITLMEMGCSSNKTMTRARKSIDVELSSELRARTQRKLAHNQTLHFNLKIQAFHSIFSQSFAWTIKAQQIDSKSF